MDITFTITMTEQQIPELIGLLGKMWANPDPAKQITIVKVQTEAPTTTTAAVPADKPAEINAAATTTAPAPVPVITAPVKPVTAAQVQQAAGAFMDANPANMTVLQGILTDLGVQAFPQIKTQEQLDTFAQKLREHGVTV